jgi:hypothetical protein
MRMMIQFQLFGLDFHSMFLTSHFLLSIVFFSNILDGKDSEIGNN